MRLLVCLFFKTRRSSIARMTMLWERRAQLWWWVSSRLAQVRGWVQTRQRFLVTAWSIIVRFSPSGTEFIPPKLACSVVFFWKISSFGRYVGFYMGRSTPKVTFFIPNLYSLQISVVWPKIFYSSLSAVCVESLVWDPCSGIGEIAGKKETKDWQ